jgi:creatinine amidohydrolase
MKLLYVLYISLFPFFAAGQVLEFKMLTTDEVREIDRDKSIILIPGGLLEQHGPYLPLYTDGYTNEALAKRIADSLYASTQFQVLIFPTIPLGVGSPETFSGIKSYPGVVYLKPATLRAVFMDIADMLGSQGFKWIFVVFKHGALSHNRALNQASDYFNDQYLGKMVNLTAFQYDTWKVKSIQLTPEEMTENGIDLHAGRDETSRMLFNQPSLVNPKYKNAVPFPAQTMDDIIKITSSAAWQGYYGSPRLASVQFGKETMDKFTHNCTELAIKILNGFDYKSLIRVGDSDPSDLATQKSELTTKELSTELESRQKNWMDKKGIKE